MKLRDFLTGLVGITCIGLFIYWFSFFYLSPEIQYKHFGKSPIMRQCDVIANNNGFSYKYEPSNDTDWYSIPMPVNALCGNMFFSGSYIDDTTNKMYSPAPYSVLLAPYQKNKEWRGKWVNRKELSREEILELNSQLSAIRERAQS